MAGQTPRNFGGLPGEFSGYEDSAVAVLPVPFERTSSWLQGSRKGPAAIIDASRHMELYDIETGTEVYRRGIFTDRPVQSRGAREMIKKVGQRAADLLRDGKFVVTLGGEHTVAVGAIKAHSGHFGPMCVLHLDAHSDMRDHYEGDRLSHACVMARAKEITGRVVSVGIRSMDSSELGGIDKKDIFYARSTHGSADWMGKVLRRLPENVYISLDLDVFDPSAMPSTGTPEPGGLGWYEVTALLRAVAERRNVVGLDVVELCPGPDRAPDFLAAKLIYKLLGYKFR